MTNLNLDPAGIFNALVSHAKALGLFDRVNGHESKNAPGNGVNADCWVANLKPYPGQSGLASTTAVLVVNVRIYSSMLADPQDAIDPNIITAAATLMGEYSGDFDLGGTVESVDLLGRTGVQLEALGGYLELDKKLYRVMTLTVPMVINDVWAQVM